MLRKIKAKMEAKDAATRQPFGVKVRPGSRFLTTGGTNWNARDPGAPSGKFLHMNTDQFNQHLGIYDD